MIIYVPLHPHYEDTMIEPVSCAISMRMNPDATFLIIRIHGIFHQCHDGPRRGPKATHYWNTSQRPNRQH